MKRRSENEGDNSTMMNLDNNPSETSNSPNGHGNRWYECKTCRKKFETFQALGGHQGRHRKVRPIDDDGGVLSLQMADATSGNLQLHQCKKCPKKFETGQALGGHMRRHKLEKDQGLILMDMGLFRHRLAVEEKLESDLLAEDVKLRRKKAEEEDEQDKAKSELVLAAKKFRLGI